MNINEELSQARKVIMNTFNQLDVLTKELQEKNLKLSQESCEGVVTLHDIDEMIRTKRDELKVLDEEMHEIDEKITFLMNNKENDSESQIIVLLIFD